MRAGRDQERRRAGEGLSAPVLRRAAAAADDRDGARLGPGHPDRRRADHGARRDGAGGDPAAARQAARRDRDGALDDHPRPRRRRRDGRPGARHERGRDGRDRGRRATCSGTPRIPTPASSSPPSRARARSAPTRSPTTAPILEVRNLEKYYGTFHALEGHQLRPARRRDRRASSASSGSGKSTAARAILRLDDPDGGEVIYRGRDLLKLSEREVFALRREIQMVFQDPTQSLNPRMSVFQLVSEAWRIHADILPKPQWRRRGGGAARPGRAQARASRPLPAPVLRRPAPAHRHRPGARHGAEDHRLRRGGLGARRLHPGAGDQAPRRAARPARASPSSSSPTTCRWCTTSPTG